MVCTLIYHRNDVIKCSKLKWSLEPFGEWFHCQIKVNAVEKGGKFV